jgi:hypothetical protein
MDKRILVLVVLVLVVAGFIFYVDSGDEITNFEECASAGNPVMESYPRQCRDPVSDRTFVEVIEEWKLDEIVLMQHESEGYFGCFGCGEVLCVDPVMEMILVEETTERYCSSEFEIVGVCSEESRNVNACIEIYQPVCAEVRVECVRAPCNPVKETYSNSCFACMNERVGSFVVGEC